MDRPSRFDRKYQVVFIGHGEVSQEDQLSPAGIMERLVRSGSEVANYLPMNSQGDSPALASSSVRNHIRCSRRSTAPPLRSACRVATSRRPRCRRSPSGTTVSLRRCRDDIAFVHNVVGKTGVHSQGTLLQTTGFPLPGFPSGGSWVSYALGCETENLPAFVVLPDHRGLASHGIERRLTDVHGHVIREMIS